MSTITRLTKVVENTKDKNAFKVRIKYYGVEDEDEIRVLWKVYKLVHFTNMFSEPIRRALWEGGNYEEIAKRYDIPFNTLKTEAYLGCRELLGVFGKDIIRDILEIKEVDKEELKDAELILDDLLNNHYTVEKEYIEDFFTVDIFKVKYSDEDFSDIDRDEFVTLRNTLVYFSRPSQQFIYEHINDRSKKYVAYLLETPENKLSGEDLQRRAEILKFTRIGECLQG